MCQIQGRFVLLVMGDDDADVEERTYGLAQSVKYDIEQNTSFKPMVTIGTTVNFSVRRARLLPGGVFAAFDHGGSKQRQATGTGGFWACWISRRPKACR